jgi:hypothetical protein
MGFRGRAAALVACLAAVALATPAAAGAATCAVPSAGYPTVESAINDVSCNPINIGPGTYTAMVSYQLNRGVTISGAGAGATTLRSTGANDVISVLGGQNVAIGDLTITSAGGRGISSSSVNNNVLLARSVVRDISGTSVGAGINSLGSLAVVDSTISGNSTTGGSGSGVSFSGSLNQTATFERVLFANNHENGPTGDGGGLSINSSGTANLTNVTFTGNTANADGGGIKINGSGTTTFNGVTISSNFADNDADGSGDGGGIATNGTVKVSVANTILALNTDKSGGAPDCRTQSGIAPVTRLGYELLGNPTGCTFGGTGDSATGLIGGNPLLGPLAANGGPNQTLALLTGSPAIDTGNPATPGSGGSACPATDQRGVARGGTAGRCDLGAFEAPGVATTAKKKCKKKKKHKHHAAAAKKHKKKCAKKKKRH